MMITEGPLQIRYTSQMPTTDNAQVDLNDVVDKYTKIDATDLNVLIPWSNSSMAVNKGIDQ